MTNTTEKKYATIVNPQINPNNTQQNEWKNIHNAVGNTDLYATSHFTKEKVSNKDKKTGKVTTSYKYNRPYKVTAHDFKLNIPSNARIENINVAVRMKTSNDKTDSVFPAVGFYIKEGGKQVSTDAGKGETGWHNGVYWVYSKKKLSSTVHSASYSMSGKEFYKGGYTVANLNSTLCGVDLYFHGDYANQTVSLMYVYMTVEYTIPTYKINTDPTSTETSPYQLKSGVKKNVKFIIKQTEDLPDVAQQMKLIVPWGTVLDGHITTKTSSPNIGSFVTDTEDARVKVWNVEFGTSGTATMTVPIIDYTIDDQILRLRNVTEPTPETPIPHKRLYYRTVRSKASGYEDVTITHEYPVRKRHTTCFQVDTVAQSDDDYVEYQITNNHPHHFVKFTVNTELTDSRVKLLTTSLPESDYSANDGITVRFEVPPNEKVSISYDVCIRPFDLGANIFQVSSSDSTLLHKSYYDVLEPYVYHIGATENDDDENIHLRFSGERINFTNHRIASNLETGAFILPCHVKDVDSVMIQGKPSIRMYKWEEVDYIGCVPLEHLHFNPKSTYKDKLLDSHYKNKRYMGKELASDEDITLNVRVHPQQVTTLQGLVDMDKPIPINANHRCFEGDALNHRGWAEIYSIKAEETNPHWYKCDIDVKYLTHNLNTRFHITKGDKTFGAYSIPSLLTEVQRSGEKLDSLSSEDDFFIVDTDGTYAYIDDEFEWEDVLDYQGDQVTWIGGSWNNGVYTGTVMTVENEDGSLTTLRAVKSETETVNEILEYLEEQNEIVKPLEMNKPIQVYEGYTIDDNLKNRFTLDEGQHISIKSRQPLSNNNKIEVSWGSSKLSENQENAISRITRLIDEDTGDIVFEYEYCDFDFSDFITYYDQTTEEVESLLRCRVICRRKNNADYDTVYDGIIDLQSDVETSEESYVSDEDLTEHTDIKYYGSSLIFELNSNVLKVIDEGYSGKEVELENIRLEGKSYRWETYWENKNTGGENNDIIAYFDVTAHDSILESKYSPMYSSMYISPFPVNGKDILFSRDGEEGVIYYLKDDDQEFSYLIEPYYQYLNGVDLRTSVDSESYISIFNLNYGYKVIYLENGLVSLGINRLNGDMYLRRYNNTLKEYVTLYRFKLNKFDDVNINSISDDRIELQASDTTIIMYRGHPYVIFRHPTEDIAITTKSYQVYGQSVDEQAYNFPIYFDLMNKDNLLPECVTKKLDDDCVNISEHLIEDLDTVKIKVRCNNQGDLFEDDIIVLEVLNDDDTQFHDRVCWLMKKDDEDGYDVIECSANPTSEPHLFTHRAKTKGTYSFIAVYVGDEQHTYSVSDAISVSVGEVYKDFKKPEQSGGGGTTGDYVLTMNCPSEMTYRDGTKVVFTLTKGGKPVKDKTIEMTDFNYTNTSMTDKNGQVSFSNNRAKNHAGKWTLGAKFWDGGNKPYRSVYKTVTVKKATPEFHVNHEAKDTKGSFSVNLRDSKNHNIKLSKRNIVIKVDNKEHKRVTNSNGSEAIAIKDKGTHKYICTFDGDKNYEKCKLKYREYVKKAE